MRILITDTETGGLSYKDHSCLSVGWLVGDLETGEELVKREYFVKLPSVEDYSITPESFAVHGITAEEAFSKGVPPEEIATQMLDDYIEYGCQYYGGHNVAYDVRFLSEHIFGFETESEDFQANFTYRCIDSLHIVEGLHGLPNVKYGKTLTSALKAFGVDMSDWPGKSHEALYDCVQCFRLLIRMRELFNQVKLGG